MADIKKLNDLDQYFEVFDNILKNLKNLARTLLAFI